MKWELSRIKANGEIDVTGNTRTGVGLEASPFTGEAKNVTTAKSFRRSRSTDSCITIKRSSTRRIACSRFRIPIPRRGQSYQEVIRRLSRFSSSPRAPTAPRREHSLHPDDDLGYGDVSTFNPQSAWQTPNIDRLRTRRIAFTTRTPRPRLCTPSRYALLTGRYAWPVR